MEFLVDYGMTIVIGLIILAYGVYMVIQAVKMSPEQRLQELYSFIRKLVEQADIYMEGQEGQDKLRIVYGHFAKQYPGLSKVISFQQFADFVEKVLADIKLEERIKEQKEIK